MLVELQSLLAQPLHPHFTHLKSSLAFRTLFGTLQTQTVSPMHCRQHKFSYPLFLHFAISSPLTNLCFTSHMYSGWLISFLWKYREYMYRLFWWSTLWMSQYSSCFGLDGLTSLDSSVCILSWNFFNVGRIFSNPSGGCDLGGILIDFPFGLPSPAVPILYCDLSLPQLSSAVCCTNGICSDRTFAWESYPYVLRKVSRGFVSELT